MPLATRALARSFLELPVIHLSDYRIPDYLVSTVDMTIKLHPTETHVTTTLYLSISMAMNSVSMRLQ
jgi:hypothetical protein